MKTSSCKQKGRHCRRCKLLFETTNKSRICNVCKAKCSECNIQLTQETKSLSCRPTTFKCKICVARCVKNSRCKDKQREYDLFRHYGITNNEYNQLLIEQGYKCAICNQIPQYKLHIDHSHSTGKIRGLLCAPCNKGLGHFKDNIILLNNALKYLGEYENI